MAPFVVHAVLISEVLDRDYRVRLEISLRDGRQLYRVMLYHPASGWLHRYGCQSLRKALKMIDETIPAEIAAEAKERDKHG